MVVEGSHDLDFRVSKVTQRQPDTLCTYFKILSTITMRVPTYRELPLSSREDEIAFLMIGFDCGVKLPLAPFVRWILSELPLHPLQVSPVL